MWRNDNARTSALVLTMFVCTLMFIYAFKGTTYNTPANQYYNSSGLMATPIKHWIGSISATSSPQTIDVSSAGFANIFLVNVTTQDNTGTVSAVPYASVKVSSTSSITVNIINNSNILSILTFSVANVAFQAPSGATLNIEVIGN